MLNPKSKIEIFQNLKDLQIACSTRAYTFRQYCAENLRRSRAESDYRTEFTKTKSYTAADALLIGGMSAEVTRALTPAPAAFRGTRTRRRNVNGVCGGVVNVGRALTGAPDCWAQRRKVQTCARVVNIIVNTGVHCGVSAAEITAAQKTVLEYIAALEARGIRCNIYAATICADKWQARERNAGVSKKYFGFAVKIKDAGERLNVTKVAYPLTHPAFQRRHAFAWLETVPGGAHFSDNRAGQMYGYATTPDRAEMQELLPQIPNAVYIHTEAVYDRDADQIKRYIDDQIKQINNHN